jgi:hypothetical protein
MITTMRDVPEGLIVERRLPVATRVAGGTACGVVAARVLFYLEPLAFVRRASPRELAENLPGLLFVVFLFLLFAVPAWVIVFWRARVVVDTDGATIRDFRNYGLFGRQRRPIPVGDVARVKAWRHVTVSKQTRTVYYQAALVLKDGREVLAVKTEDRTQADDIARTLAQRLRVRVEGSLEEE